MAKVAYPQHSSHYIVGKMNRLGIICLITVFLMSCAEPQHPTVEEEPEFSEPETVSEVAPQLPPLSEGVILELEVDLSQAKRPVLVGKTNLPDGTTIMTSVQGETSDFLGQDRATVKNGSFRVGPFGPASGLANGEYVAGATMPLPRLQSESVKAIIGQNGENLKGPLVKRDALGATVSVDKGFQIGNEAQIEEARGDQQQAVVEARAVLRDLRDLVQKGRDMESLRDRNNQAKLKECGEKMRKNQAEVENLRSRADALPKSIAFDLAVAAGSMNRCVSCLPGATESCDIAESSLNDAEDVLQGQ